VAESSLFWSTGSTGDGITPYTQTQLLDWLSRTFIANLLTQGVIYNSGATPLAVSGTASPIQVAAGAAMVFGIPYSNSITLSLPITTPSVGTTGWRVVLRANYTAQTVRAVLLVSPDGTATAPALTQSIGATWDISLATGIIITGSGAIAITADTRSFIFPNGSTAVQEAFRQGGNSTDWTTAGTTNYAVLQPRIETGVISLTAAVALAVSFGNSFNGSAPMIFFQGLNLGVYAQLPQLSAVSSTGFTVNAPVTGTWQWLAIGPGGAGGNTSTQP
jgi:hypothetical protein